MNWPNYKDSSEWQSPRGSHTWLQLGQSYHQISCKRIPLFALKWLSQEAQLWHCSSAGGGKTDYAVSEFHTYCARQIIQDHDHLSMTKTLIRTNILIIASSLVEWCRVSFLHIRDQGSMESRSQSFSSTFICNIFLWKSGKPNISSQKNKL